MARTKIGSNATFTGTQKGLSIIGDHCYAASGEINPNNSTLTALHFTTGKQYIIAKIMWGVDMTDFDTGKDVGLFIKLNGILVYQVRGQLSLGGDFDGIVGSVKVPILLTPLTDVEVEVSTTQANTVGQTVILHGRVYG